MPDDLVRRALRAHAHNVDFSVSKFSAELDAVVSRAQSQLQQDLLALKLDPLTHRVLRTPANIRLLRRLPQLWRNALDTAGLSEVISRYLAAYPQQIPAFRDVLAAVNQVAKEPLPLPSFNQDDHAYFSGLAQASGAEIRSAVQGAANGVIVRSAFAVGAVPYKALVKTIVSVTDTSKARAETIANTALHMMYRTVSANAYDKIQTKVTQPLRFKYLNPRDRVTRPFCLDLLDKNSSYTKEEILQMTNGQGLPVWTSCGGFQCRGSWNIEPIKS